MPLPIRLVTTATLPACLSSAKSLFGRSKEMSASPRSISARRLPAEGTWRQTMRLAFGSGPLFQSSLRSNTTSVPACQRVTL